MKKILFLICMSIGFIQITNAQVIEVIGNGVLNDANLTLTIPNMENVTKVVVEAAALFVYYETVPTDFPANITFTSGEVSKPVSFNTIEEMKSPLLVENYGSGVGTYYKNIYSEIYAQYGYYTAEFQRAQIADGKISLNKAGQGNNIATFFAYVYRTNGDVSIFSNNPLKRAFLYLNGATDPLVRNFSIPAPTSATKATRLRNMEVAVPLSDGNDIDNRIGVITLISGQKKTKAKVFKLNDGNVNFHVEKLMLHNVPMDVTNASLEIYSPTDPPAFSGNTGDSYIVGLPVLTLDDCGECKGGVTALKLKYTGSALYQKIRVYKDKVDLKNLLYTFNAGESIDFIGKEKNETMGSNIIITIDGTLNTEIHTSCSQDIYAGMQFGDFLIESGTSKDGGPLCFYEDPPCGECKGGVTALELKYTGSGPAEIIVYNDKVELAKFPVVSQNQIIEFDNGGEKLGTEINITVNGGLPTPLHTSCSQPIYPGMKFGAFEIVSGSSKYGGPFCPYEEPPCGECKGGVTALTLKYLGIPTVNALTVKTDQGTVIVQKAADNTFSIYNGGAKLGTNIYITVDGKTTALHTSCSQPIYPGMKFGTGEVFEIVSGTSKYGGPFCPEPQGNGECVCEGGVDYLEVDYYGTGTVLRVENKDGKINGASITPRTSTPPYQNIKIDNGVDKLGTNIYFIFADGTSTALHTSCSQPIWVTMTFGGVGGVDFKIVDGSCLDGGDLCNVPYIKQKSATIENIEPIAEIHEFEVYPNPALDITTVSFMPTNNGLTTVELYNSLGQKAGILFNQSVTKEVPVSFTFSGQQFKEGLYILILKNGDYMETSKLRIAK